MEAHFIQLFISANLYRQPFRKRVGNGRAYPVQTARIFVVALPEFPAGVKLGKNKLNTRNLFFRVYIGGNPSSVIFYGRAPVAMQGDRDSTGVAVRRLVDRVIHDLPKNMMQTLNTGGTDIHTGTHTHRVKPL